jgi:glutathione peroxidase
VTVTVAGEATTAAHTGTMTVLGDFTATTLDGRVQPLADYSGQVVLVVNTASKCGLTPQFAGLQELYETYAERGFVVLGFPCGQFAGQELDSAHEIGAFCSQHYGVTFPMFAKIDVNGRHTAPLFSWLKRSKRGATGGPIAWNFTKFLIARDGTPLKRFAPDTQPRSIAHAIELALAASATTGR